MKIEIQWTESLIRGLGGSLVESNGEICVLCWDQIDYSKRETRVWLLSSRDGMLYLYGNNYAEAADKLNANKVKIYHGIERVSISGKLL